VTYGESTADLREAMIELLRRHRIVQSLGGPGQPTVPESTTVEERRELGAQIRRYRCSILVWCHQALVSVTPKFTEGVTRQGRRRAEELRDRVGEAVEAVTVGLPGLAELATPHPNTMVETWRRAARGSVLGEHDFAAGVEHTRLDGSQSRAVLKDAADIVRGLIVLDRRYANVPGWEFLKNPGRLGLAAEVCSVFASRGERDYAVDGRGWRPPLAEDPQPALPGYAGVVQAQHNLLVALSAFPDALNLRRILRTQARAAHEAGRHAASAAPDLVARFLDREQTYQLLQRNSRDLGGLVGDGGVAAAESHSVQARLRRTPVGDPEAGPALRQLARYFAGTDARLASTLEYGLAEKLYFVSVESPRPSDEETEFIQQRLRWLPVTSPVQTDLLPLARGRLRPCPAPQAAAPDAVESRRSYELLLARQPGFRSQPRPPR
jgi:hypothetical protein